jgi:hypothetical protein
MKSDGMSYMTRHKQVKVLCRVFGESSAIEKEVDEKIAPLLVALWDRGIITIMSCQERDPGIMWIMFYRVEDLKKFLDTLLDGIGDKDIGLFGRKMAGNWSYELDFNDNREDFVDEKEEDTFINYAYKSDVDIMPSVRFPVLDFDEVLKVFTKKRSSNN